MVDNGSSMKRKKKKCPSLTLCCFQIPHCRRSHHNQLQLAMISPRISIVVSSSPGWTLQGKLKFVSVEIQSVEIDLRLLQFLSLFAAAVQDSIPDFSFFSSNSRMHSSWNENQHFESQPSPAMHLWAFLTVKTKTHSRRINLITWFLHTFELGRVRQVWLGSAQGKNRREAIFFLFDVFWG